MVPRNHEKLIERSWDWKDRRREMLPQGSSKGHGRYMRDRNSLRLSRLNSLRNRRRWCRGTRKCARRGWRNTRNLRGNKAVGIIRMGMKCLLKYIKHPLCITGLVVIKVGKAGLNLLDIWDRKNTLALFPKSGCTRGLATIKESRELSSFLSMGIYCCQLVMMVLSRFGMYLITEDVWEPTWGTQKQLGTFVSAMMEESSWVLVLIG